MPRLVARCLSEEEFDRLKAEGAAAELTEDQLLTKLEADGVGSAADKAPPAAKPKPPPIPAVTFTQLFRFASAGDRAMVVLGCFFACAQGAFMPSFALVMGGLIDSFADRDGSGSTGFGVQELGVGLVLLGGLAFVAAFFQGGLLQVAAARQQPKIKQAYLAAILRQDVTWMDLNPPGKVQSTIAQDMDLVTDAMGDKFGEAIQTIVQFVLGLLVGFVVSWQLSLLTLGLVPVMAVSMGFLMATIMKISARIQLTQANAASISQESTGSIRTVCSLTSQDATMKRYEKEVDRIQTSASEFHKSLATSLGGFMFSIYASYSLAMWYGSTLVEDEVITGGQVIRC
jgi:ATP-binding cassette subfamily B (MDR/TAP) protein 1